MIVAVISGLTIFFAANSVKVATPPVAAAVFATPIVGASVNVVTATSASNTARLLLLLVMLLLLSLM